MYKRANLKFVNIFESENFQKIEIVHSNVPAMSKEYAMYTSILFTFDLLYSTFTGNAPACNTIS